MPLALWPDGGCFAGFGHELDCFVDGGDGLEGRDGESVAVCCLGCGEDDERVGCVFLHEGVGLGIGGFEDGRGGC